MESINNDRPRTNLLRKYEQHALAFLVRRIPPRVTSNMLTALGLFGGIIVCASFILAVHLHRNFLLLGLLGFAINWLGDSLDGRLAYFRKRPRESYGFALDITVDWISIVLIGFGYIIYAEGAWEFIGYGFVVMYGLEMLIALMRYRISGKYSIDSGKIGPTEVRIIISALMVAEVLLPGSLSYSGIVVIAILLTFNILDIRKLLRDANDQDIIEKKLP